MRARLFGIALVTSSVALVACDEDSTGPFAEFAGTFDLVAVDGEPLPYVYDGGSFTLTYTEGELELDGDGTWSDMLVFTVDDLEGGTYVDTVSYSGTFEEGEEFDLVLDPVEVDAVLYQADVDGDQVVYQRGAIEVTFED